MGALANAHVQAPSTVGAFGGRPSGAPVGARTTYGLKTGERGPHWGPRQRPNRNPYHLVIVKVVLFVTDRPADLAVTVALACPAQLVLTVHCQV